MPPPEDSAQGRTSRGAARLRSFAFKAGVSALLLTFLLRTIVWEEMRETALRIRPSFFFASLMLVFLNRLLVSYRLQILMRPTDLHLPLMRLFRIGFIARFYALFLPAGLGITLGRWYKVTENKVGRVQFLIVNLIEKSFFFSSLFSLRACPSPFLRTRASRTSAPQPCLSWRSSRSGLLCFTASC